MKMTTLIFLILMGVAQAAKYLPFDSVSAAEARASELAIASHCVNAATKTAGYASLIVHPQIGKVLLPIESVYDHQSGRSVDVETLLTNDEKNSLLTDLDICLVECSKFAGAKTPKNISSLSAWYKSGIGMTVVSGAISKWEDQSGNSCSATQSVSGSRPTVVSSDSDFNGNTSLVFDGVNDHLRCDSLVSFINGTDAPYTVFTVHKKDATGGQFLFDMGTSGANGSAQWCVGVRHYNRNIYLQDKRDSKEDPEVNFEVGTSGENPEVVAWLCGGKSGETLVDNVSVGSGSLAVGSLDCVYATIGGFPDYNSPNSGNINGPFKGKIVEVIVYGKLLNQSELSVVQNYLNQKFNLY
jgi:hypothetical protein